MTEMEWLKKKSGLSDDDLKEYASVLGNDKFKSMLSSMVAAEQSALAENSTARQAKEAAEQARIDFENRYTKEFIPEMQKVTTDALNAQGEVAKLKAQLEAARQYGIVPQSVEPTAAVAQATRAPGSPDPSTYVSKDEFGRLRTDIGTMSIRLSDLNGKHFKLFGAPLDNAQALVEKYQREVTLGHQPDIERLWEQEYNVPAKREELRLADAKKHDDEVRAAAVADYKQKNPATGSPYTRSLSPSRFSTFDPKDSGGSAQKPWQAPAGMKKNANKPLHDWAVNKVATALTQ